MKVTKLSVKNIGIIEDAVVELNKPLILFYGDIRQGKTTLLTAVRLLFGGEFPSDIIRHGCEDAIVSLEFSGGLLERSFYKAKDGSTKSRAITFVRDGKPVPAPVAEIKRLLNPFLLDQNHLLNMGETERKKFFTELFAVDTKQLDVENFECSRRAATLRTELGCYGDIDLTKHEPVDIATLQTELLQRNTRNQEAITAARASEEKAKAHNRSVDAWTSRSTSTKAEISRLKNELKLAEQRLVVANNWLTANPLQDVSVFQQVAIESTEEIQKKISDASAQNVRAEQYQKNLKRETERASKASELPKIEARQRAIRDEKIAKLKGISDSSGVPGLSFDEAGEFFYQGTQASMLSTSQIMELSNSLSALYPEGFGLDLIDRGESLGKSIFGFVDRAKAENKTILATIVGEKPSVTPADVGVFVVEAGKVSAA